MSIPYKVTVKGKGNDIKVTVRPQPIATKQEYLQYIGKTIDHAIIDAEVNKKNTLANRHALKNRIIELLTYFHNENMIEPKKEKDEANRHLEEDN